MSVVPVPEHAVLLHIGPHKTGTTAIQGILTTAREQMAEHGVLYPGTSWSHADEARAVLNRPAGWLYDSAPLPDQSRWRDLVESVHAAPGRVVLSSEFFALADAEQRARVVEDLGADRLHILVAARNPGSIVLSTWQQVLRDGKTGRLEEFLRRGFERDRPGHATSGFWSWADAANQVEDWAPLVGVDRLRVVVIDESDRTLLPTTFEQLLGLPAGLLSSVAPPSQNRSLTAPEAELLRRATELVKPELRWEEFSLFFRMGYARRLLDHRTVPRDEARSALPAWATEQAAAEAAAMIERLDASGVTVIGDLDDLRRVPAPAEPQPIDEVPVDLAAEALAGVMLAAQRRLRKTQRRADRAERQVRRLAKGTDRPPAGLDGVPASELASELASRARRKIGLGGRDRTAPATRESSTRDR